MCESHVYLLKDGVQKMIMEDVVFIRPQGEQLYLQNLLGNEQTVDAKISEIRFMEHKIILEPTTR